MKAAIPHVMKSADKKELEEAGGRHVHVHGCSPHPEERAG